MLALTLTAQGLKDIMNTLSTKLHTLGREIDYVGFITSQLTDEQIEQIFTDGGSVTAETDRAAFRDWMAAVEGLTDNYKGEGTVTNKSALIAPRANIYFV